MLTNALQKQEVPMPGQPPANLKAIESSLQADGLLTEEVSHLIITNRTDSLARQLAATAEQLCERINSAGGEKVHAHALVVGNTPEKRRLRTLQECIQKLPTSPR